MADVSDTTSGDLGSLDTENLGSILAFLHKRGFNDAEAALAREAGRPVKTDGDYNAGSVPSVQMSDGSAMNYRSEYRSLMRFVQTVSDRYKPELRCILYPTFANVYLELIANAQYEAANDFFTEFAPVQLDYWQQFTNILKYVATSDQLNNSPYANCLRTGQFIIRVSRQSLNELKTFLLKHTLLQGIMRTRLHIECRFRGQFRKLRTLDAPPRSAPASNAISGNALGEPAKSMNKQKVLYGLLRDDTMPDEGGKKSSLGGKKASRRDDKSAKKAKDPAAPPPGRIPLPEIVTNMSFSEDNLWLATGGADSSVNVWTLNDRLLMPLKHPDELDKLDKESDSILTEMLDDTKQQGVYSLRAHSGPVYGTSFSPDKRLLLSSSADSTVRLWSTQLWHNLVVYQLGGYPIWDVQFSPRGYYFATGGGDNSAALWCTERLHPVRLFAEHTAGVRCVQFHPNANYVMAADAHREVRMYDVLSGQCVRSFPGMKSSASSVCVSPDGRLVAACSDTSPGSLCVWDIPTGRQLVPISDPVKCPVKCQMSCKAVKSHVKCPAKWQTVWDCTLVACSPFAPLHCVSFGKVDSSVLLCGGVEDQVKVLGVDQLVQQATEDAEPKTEGSALELYDFATRKTRVLAVTTTARNVVLGAGVFDQ